MISDIANKFQQITKFDLYSYFTDYADLFSKYDTVQKISFDYAVAEHEPDIAVMRFGHNNALAADINLVVRRYLVAQYGGLSVDFNLALHNKLLGFSARGNAAL